MDTLVGLAIVVVALFQIAAAAALIVLAWQLWQLARLVQAKFGDLSTRAEAALQQAQAAAASAAEGARTFKGSVSFVSDTVVTPVIGVAAAVAGASRFVNALFRDEQGRESREAGG